MPSGPIQETADMPHTPSKEKKVNPEYKISIDLHSPVRITASHCNKKYLLFSHCNQVQCAASALRQALTAFLLSSPIQRTVFKYSKQSFTVLTTLHYGGGRGHQHSSINFIDARFPLALWEINK